MRTDYKGTMEVSMVDKEFKSLLKEILNTVSEDNIEITSINKKTSK